MAMNTKDFKNMVKLSGVIEGYYIQKDDKAIRKFDGGDRFKKGDKYTSYEGSIDIRTSENDVVRVRVQSEYQKNQQGEVTAQTETLEAMSKNEIPTYKKTQSLAETPLISIWGVDKQGNPNLKFSDNYYVGQDGTMIENIDLSLGFARITVKEPNAEATFDNELLFQNEFQVYGVITDLKEEMVKDEETGRVLVKIQVPYTYGSEEKGNLVVRAMPMTLIAGMSVDEEGEFDMAELIMDEEEENGVVEYSWKVTGHIHGWTDVPEQPKAEETTGRRRLGRKVVDTTAKGKFKQELMVDGIEILGEDGDVFDLDDLKDAINARRVDMDNKAKKKAQEKDAGKSEGRTSRIGGRSGDDKADKGESTSTATTSGRSRKRSW